MYWTKERLIEDAKKYTSRVEWKKASQSAYALACASNWLDICCSHMERLVNPAGYWTRERCKEDAGKYKTKKKWAKDSGGAYDAALSNNWIDECCEHMEITGNRVKRALYAFEHPDKSVYVGLTYNYDERYESHMSKNKVLIEKYKLDGHIFKRFNIWYPIDIAGKMEIELIEEYRNNGWVILNKVKGGGGLGGNVLKWTKGAIVTEALKYTTRTEFRKNSNGAYSAACKIKILDEVCAHMTQLIHKDYTIEEIQNIALGCKTKTEFRKVHGGVCMAARKFGIFDEVCAHMLKGNNKKDEKKP